MSLSYKAQRPVLLQDPRTLVDNERMYSVLSGGSQVTYKQWTTQSISSTSLQFSMPPPSGGVFVDRKVQIYVPVRLTFTGVPAINTKLLRSGFDAPRSWPFAGAVDTLTATINNQSVSINTADVIHPMADWFNSDHAVRCQDWSSTPTYPDQSASYDTLIGGNNNPLGNYATFGSGSEAGRGAFSDFVIVSNPTSPNGTDTITAVVDLAVTEPLFLPPFEHNKGISSSGFFNVTSMDLNINMIGQNAANRMWSHSSASGGAPIVTSNFVFGGNTGGPTSFSSKGGNQVVVLAAYITPKETQILSPNEPITYPYFEVTRYPTTQANVPAFGASGYNNVVMASNNIQISSWPRRMYVFARQQNQDLYSSASNTDTYMAIQNINLTVANKNGLLASASQESLYQMAVKNGYQGSWTQWSGITTTPGTFGIGTAGQVGTSGSICCFEFATDIGLDSLSAPGKLEQTQIQVQVTATNINPAAITPTLYIIIINEGTFTIERLGASTTNIGVLTSNDIMNAKPIPGLSYKDMESVSGGDFFSGLKNIASRFHDWIKDNKVISRYVAPAVGTLSAFTGPFAGPLRAAAAMGGPLAASYGYGQGGARAGGRQQKKMTPYRQRARGRGGEDDEPAVEEYDEDYEEGGYGGEEISSEQLTRRIMY